MTHAQDEPIVGRLLHLNLLAGDPLAREEIFGRYHQLLVDYLRAYVKGRSLYSADEDLILGAAIEALGSYLERPAQYDPDRGKSLAGYLEMSAVGDLKNALTRSRPPAGMRLVGFEAVERNEPLDETDEGSDDVEQSVARQEFWDRVAELIDGEDEQIVLRLMRRGERQNTVYAQALGWSHLPSSEQAPAVNQIKERLMKRLKRRFAGERIDDYAD